MVDTSNTSNNGGHEGDDNNDDANENNCNGPKSPPSDMSQHEREPNNEFGPYDGDILNKSRGSPRHDRSHEMLLRSAKKVTRAREELLARA